MSALGQRQLGYGAITYEFIKTKALRGMASISELNTVQCEFSLEGCASWVTWILPGQECCAPGFSGSVQTAVRAEGSAAVSEVRVVSAVADWLTQRRLCVTGSAQVNDVRP